MRKIDAIELINTKTKKITRDIHSYYFLRHRGPIFSPLETISVNAFVASFILAFVFAFISGKLAVSVMILGFFSFSLLITLHILLWFVSFLCRTVLSS